MSTNIELKDIHWLIDMVHNIDVGLVIIDKDFNVKLWNGFMENHSGLLSAHMIDKRITDVFTSIPEDWLKQKVNSVCLLNNKAFTTWEQRPYLFKFKCYRPITSSAEFMYQNVTFLPLIDILGNVTQICMIIYDVTDVALNRQELQKANKQLKHLSHTDSLTQLYNQGYWRERCATEFVQHKNLDQPTSLLLIDIDRFKNVNDTYGHSFGDQVIRGVADVLRQHKTELDIAGRIGGEEFTLLLANKDLSAAKLTAEGIRQSIEKMTFETQGTIVKITISIGVAQITATVADHESWVNIADLGLYIAKNNGRNQIGISAH
tara:strand:+ start:625 stop:1581 length:957 start_codon:yes stop_codon:yes gene_type:complete